MATFTRLDNEALLLLSGPDALTFLQGQATCDTREISPERAIPGAYCTPQGRVVCDFLLLQLGQDSYALRMRDSIAEHAAAVFGKYIVFSKAEITPAGDTWFSLGIWGDNAGATVTEVFGACPDVQYASHCGEGFAVVQLDDHGEAFECCLRSADAEQYLEALAQRLQPGETGPWQAMQVSAGIARVEAATVDEFVPQSLNYDLTGHVSFTKGCYTGQEVVARLHYRGTPKRRTRLMTVADDIDAAPADKVFSADKAQSVGDVLNSAPGPEGLLLLVAVADKALDGPLHLGAQDGAVLTLQALPYTVDDVPDAASQGD